MTSFSLTQRALPCPLAHRTPESGWGFQVLSRLRTPGPAFAPSAKVGSVFWASMSVMGADVEKTIVTTGGSGCFALDVVKGGRPTPAPALRPAPPE